MIQNYTKLTNYLSLHWMKLQAYLIQCSDTQRN